jgi:hypothetical protein
VDLFHINANPVSRVERQHDQVSGMANVKFWSAGAERFAVYSDLKDHGRGRAAQPSRKQQTKGGTRSEAKLAIILEPVSTAALLLRRTQRCQQGFPSIEG